MIPHKIALTPFMVKVISMIDKYDVLCNIMVMSDKLTTTLHLVWIGYEYVIHATVGVPCSDKIYVLQYDDKNIVRKIDVTYDGIEEWVKSLK